MEKETGTERKETNCCTRQKSEMKASSTKCKYRAPKDASAADRDSTWKGEESLG